MADRVGKESPFENAHAPDIKQEESLHHNSEQLESTWTPIFVDGAKDGLWIASNAASFGVGIARFWTKFGLQIGRRATQLGVGIPAMIADAQNGDPAVSTGRGALTTAALSAVDRLFDGIDWVTLGSISIGGRIAEASLSVAADSFGFFQGELAQCLASIARLVHRNWNHQDDRLPPGGLPAYSALQVLRGLMAWVSIQQATHRLADARIMSGLTRLDVSDLRMEIEAEDQKQRANRSSGHAPLVAIEEPRITTEMIIPEDGGDLVSAEIGYADDTTTTARKADHVEEILPLTPAQAVLAFARYSRLTLAVYGGAALRIWGVDVPYGVEEKAKFGAARNLLVPNQDMAPDSAESRENADITRQTEEDGGVGVLESESEAAQFETNTAPTLIDLLSGKHDDDVLRRYAGLEQDSVQTGLYPSKGTNSASALPFKPKYYVVTDHDSRKVILVLRGTLSLSDAAADLTCESVPFVNMDAFHPAPRRSAKIVPNHPPARGQHHNDNSAMLVHEGMYLTALAIGGSTDAPVHRAIATALRDHPTYDLDLTGHSLGAGVSAMLALLWAGLPDHDPASVILGKTSAASGLPPGHSIHAYCFAPPPVMSAPLARKCANFITGWSNSFDVVPRLSLGTILDIRNACAWLLYKEAQDQGNSHANVVDKTAQGPFNLSQLIRQAVHHVSSNSTKTMGISSFASGILGRWSVPSDEQRTDAAETEAAFWALRQLLEAQMGHVELYPAGNMLLTMEAGTLAGEANRQLFWLNDPIAEHNRGAGARGLVYGQMEFRAGFLHQHLAHVYHAILASVLNREI